MLLVGSFRPVVASEFAARPLEEVAAEAAHIVVVTVVGARSRWATDDHRSIVTDYSLQIDDVLRSDTLSGGVIVSATIGGGTVDGWTYARAGLRQPAVGERSVWLLAEASSEDRHRLSSSRFGVLRLTAANALAARDDSPVTALATTGAVVNAMDALRLMRQSRQIVTDRPPHSEMLSSLPSVAAAADALGASAGEPYLLDGRRALPIRFNPLPAGTFGTEDVLAAQRWNHYASVFQVLAPRSSWSPRDGIVDNAGFLSAAELDFWFGGTWDPRDLATTFTRAIGDVIIDADIAFNPAASWSVNDAGVYAGSGLVSYVHTIAHELGHAAGLGHEFDELSVMNYPPGRYRGFSMLYWQDAEALRANYPSAAIARRDVGIHLYAEGPGQMRFTEAAYPSVVAAGGALTVTGFTVENVGTASSGGFTVAWWLRTSLNPSAPGVLLGRTEYGSLSPDFRYPPSTARASLTVPATTPAGSYYLAASIEQADEGPVVPYFPWSNNHGFSTERITVTAAPSASAPGAPTGVSAVVAAGQVTISWGPPATGGTVSDYVLEAGTATALSNLYNASVGLATRVSSPVSAGVYFVRVRARNAAGISAPSNEAAFSVGGAPTPCGASPPPPSGITGSVQSGIASLRWSPAPGATAYVVTAGSVPGGADVYDGNVGATVEVSAAVSAGFRAYARVYAINSCGRSVASQEVLLQ